MAAGRLLEDVWRREAPYVLAALLRRHGDLGDCEDAAQEAAEAAARQWGMEPPHDPRSWLIRVASRRLLDRVRSDSARGDREVRVHRMGPRAESPQIPGPEAADNLDDLHRSDDPIRLLFMCCHPALSQDSQIALTLKSVVGLSTKRIAASFFIPEPTMAQRLSRARTRLRTIGARFEMPSDDEIDGRLDPVLEVCHVMAAEAHISTGGQELIDEALWAEAVRLARSLVAAFPDRSEIRGLLALLLLTGARASSRTDPNGDLVALADQDRKQWDRSRIGEGITILEQVLPVGNVGRFQLEAAIAAVHCEAVTFDDTDWEQILVLYSMLNRVAPSPAVVLNRAVALSEVAGPLAALHSLDALGDAQAMSRYHRFHAVKGHLLAALGRSEEALREFRTAAELSTNIREQRYLNHQIINLSSKQAASESG